MICPLLLALTAAVTFDDRIPEVTLHDRSNAAPLHVFAYRLKEPGDLHGGNRQATKPVTA